MTCSRAVSERFWQTVERVAEERLERREGADRLTLTADQVADIRVAWHRGASKHRLARQFGVSRHAVAAIVRGDS